MNTSRINYRGPHIERPEQFEKGKTVLNPEQLKVLSTLSYLLGSGYDDHLESYLREYTFKGLIDLLNTRTKGQLESTTMNASQAHQAYALIDELIARAD
ncbi:hypothetical protein QWY14_05325 [Planococcus sp. N028]|uniref:Uncharacterized protein n=1 Tax=Planococcus shixiaomingii TaxID=3058393 RepID=A0ABT8N000_9BACL|nr:hypothetical protein [Planococcus sp. N028]MDN7241200.1 hypothetical protein [Planococcus sp. N028]